MTLEFDIIVVGGGHAGCEAATAAARLGSRTLLITMNLDRVAQMSCNPAVGGIAKGQIVREIDALGGHMAEVTDRASIQFRLLNRSKGPAMWSPRAQCDRMAFSASWRHVLEHTDGLALWQDTVTSLTLDGDRVTGVTTALGVTFTARAVVLTAGTFLGGLMHVGRVQTPGGRVGEPAATGLTAQLSSLGITAGRMKTGTPPRLDGRTIDFGLAERQDGDSDGHHFAFDPAVRPTLPQRPCWIVNTNEAVHQVLRDALPESPLYNGQIQSIGPRYCPSIETKIVTFAEKTSHQLFIEPEGVATAEMYLNGFSSSLPWQVQIDALHHIPALRDVRLYRPGYAIEYDWFDPTQLRHSLESKVVHGLFMAGQVNGTTGYEEAAGQGLVAGVNAHRHCHDDEPMVLRRDQAYIGVLIDDLVTKGVDEPYRMFTSRAEHRILLRQDDADRRLLPVALQYGLIDARRQQWMAVKVAAVETLERYLADTTAHPAEVNGWLESLGEAPLRHGQPLRDLLLRPTVTLEGLADVVPSVAGRLAALPDTLRDDIVETVQIQVKYAGYIARERETAERLTRLEAVTLRGKFDYSALTQLSTEARQKLQRIDPETLGQASRIPGVSPSDVNLLLLLLGR